MSCIHRALKSAAPSCTDSPVPVPQAQRWIPKGKGSEKRQYDESPEFSVATNIVLVSDGLKSTLTRSTELFKIFLGEHAPQPPDKTGHALDTLERRMASDERAKASMGTRLARAHGKLRPTRAAPIPTLQVCPPPSSISVSAPVKVVYMIMVTNKHTQDRDGSANICYSCRRKMTPGANTSPGLRS